MIKITHISGASTAEDMTPRVRARVARSPFTAKVNLVDGHIEVTYVKKDGKLQEKPGVQELKKIIKDWWDNYYFKVNARIKVV